MSAAPFKKKSSTGFTILLVVLVACPIGVAMVGVLAAIAIPAFVGYVARSKTSEATSNLAEIARRMESYRAEFGRYPSARANPPTPSCNLQLFPPDESWAQIGFSPFDPVRYSYEAEGDTDRYVIRARGDLDCDGIYSLYERTSDSPQIRVESELE